MILGKTYRKMREEKGISISSLAGAEISKSQISRFELGETEISFFKLVYLLEKTGMTLEEFLLACNDYRPPEFHQFLQKLEQARYQQDSKLLTHFLEQERNSFQETSSQFHQLNALVLKSILDSMDPNQSFNPEDTTLLANYLFSIDNWGYYEIFILKNCVAYLPPDLLFYYTREALEKGQVYQSIPRNEQALIQLLLNTLFIMVEEEMEQEALFLKQAGKKLIGHSTTYFFEQTLLLYLDGYSNLKWTKDKEANLAKIEQALSILKTFNPVIYQDYNDYFDQHIKHLF